jgi:lipopolysaccharide transport system permease protein
MSKGEVEVIKPKKSLLDINLRELWEYRDLVFLFVRRDFISVYKQTVLGPLWFFIQPIFTTLIYTVIFGKLAAISTDGINPVLFYLSGITCWNYFAECLTKTSNTFTSNASIFGKVYFPRLVLPVSIVISNLLKFTIQFLLFSAFLLFFYFRGEALQINSVALILPILIFLMAGLGLGFGILISSLTTKYRDFQFLVVFGVQLFMYATPVVYPMSLAQEKLGKYNWLVEYNPMAPIIEAMKYGFLGSGTFEFSGLLYTFFFMLVVLTIGVVVFNKVEKNFMDTV